MGKDATEFEEILEEDFKAREAMTSILIMNEYKEKYELYNECLSSAKSIISSLIEKKGIKKHSINYRVKEESSLKAKIKEKQVCTYSDEKSDFVFKYGCLSDITDVGGLRICTYYDDDVDEIAKIIESEFNVDKENSINKTAAMEPDRFGYLSVHYVVSFNEKRLELDENSEFKGIKFEVQIRTILQHTWAEIEHDLGYKSKEDIPNSIKRDFSRLAGLLELADREFLRIRDWKEEYRKEVSDKLKKNRNLENIRIDSITIRLFEECDFFTELIKTTASKIPGTQTVYPYKSYSPLLGALDYFEIKTIKDLQVLLIKSNGFIVKLLTSYFNESPINGRAYFSYTIVFASIDKKLTLDQIKLVNQIAGIQVSDKRINGMYNEFRKIYDSVTF